MSEGSGEDAQKMLGCYRCKVDVRFSEPPDVPPLSITWKPGVNVGPLRVEYQLHYGSDSPGAAFQNAVSVREVVSETSENLTCWTFQVPRTSFSDGARPVHERLTWRS
jgi:hypothetical protein